jgi:acetyl esterase/lipase
MLSILLLVQVAGAASPPFVTPQFPVKVSNDLEYARAPVRSPAVSEKSLLLDLYEPDGDSVPALRPGFVAVHGGGLTRGDKRTENMVELCRELASRGYTCISINYRLLGDDPPADGVTPMSRTLSAAIEDAERAVTWLRNGAGRYHVDPDRIAAGGSSAGAAIVLRLAYRGAGPLAPVRAIFSWVGGLDGREDMLDAGEPPLFMVSGAVDTSVPASEARALAERARRVAVPYQILVCEGLGHNVPLDRRPGGVSIYHRLAAFLHRHLDLSRIGRKPETRQREPSRAGVDTRAVPCPK